MFISLIDAQFVACQLDVLTSPRTFPPMAKHLREERVQVDQMRLDWWPYMLSPRELCRFQSVFYQCVYIWSSSKPPEMNLLENCRWFADCCIARARGFDCAACAYGSRGRRYFTQWSNRIRWLNIRPAVRQGSK